MSTKTILGVTLKHRDALDESEIKFGIPFLISLISLIDSWLQWQHCQERPSLNPDARGNAFAGVVYKLFVGLWSMSL